MADLTKEDDPEVVHPTEVQLAVVPVELQPLLHELSKRLEAASIEITLAIAMGTLADLLGFEEEGALVLVVRGEHVGSLPNSNGAAAAAYFSGSSLSLNLFKPARQHRPA